MCFILMLELFKFVSLILMIVPNACKIKYNYNIIKTLFLKNEGKICDNFCLYFCLYFCL